MKVYRGVCDVEPLAFRSMSFSFMWGNLGLTGVVVVVVEREDDPNIRGDAFKTLFVARLSYDTTEKDLEREFGRFGPIERVCITGLILVVGLPC